MTITSMPAAAIGTTIAEITTRYSPNSQRALRMSPMSLHSTTATWNCRGRHTMARKLSRVCEMKPTGGVFWNKVRADCSTWPSRPLSQT